MPTTLANPGDSIATMRFKEPYVSQGLNKKLFGLIGSGVVRGGKLATTGLGFGVNITADAIEGDSIYSYQDVNGLQFTVRQAGLVPLDLSALAGQTVYVCLYVGYTIGATTVVQWRAYTQAELFTAPVAEAAFVVILGRIVVPGVGPIPAANITPTARRTAWDDRAPEGWHQVVKNGDFEAALAAGGTSFFGIQGWIGTGFGTPNFRISTTAPYSGTREFNLQMPAPLATNSRLLQQERKVRVEPGQFVRGRVRLRGLLWAGIDPAGHQGMAFSFYTNDMVLISTLWVENNALTGTFAYTLVDGIVEAPATAAWMRVSVGIDNNGASLGAGDIFFDDARAWVESQHPLVDVVDESILDSIAAEVLAITPSSFESPAPVTMDDYVRRTLLLLKSAQLAGPPLLETVLAVMRGSAPWRLLLSKGQLRSGGFANTEFDIPRMVSEWISSGAIAANWTVLWEIGNSSASVNKVRFYARHGQVAGPSEAGDFAIATNARWDGTNWNKDDTSRKAFMMRVNAQEDVTGTLGGFSFFYVDEATNTWADTGWQQTMNFGSAGSKLEDAAILFTIPSGYTGQILTAMSGNVAGQGDFHIHQRVADGALIISHNADWDPVGLLWNYDDVATTSATRLVMVDETITIERFLAAGPTWAEAAWVVDMRLGYDPTAGAYVFIESGPASAALDPGGPNRVLADNITKFWAVIETNGAGGITLVDGFNVNAVSLPGGNVARLTFHDNFSVAGQNPFTGSVATTGSAPLAEFTSFNTSNSSRVDVAVFDATAAGAAVNLATTARRVHIIGTGHQT